MKETVSGIRLAEPVYPIHPFHTDLETNLGVYITSENRPQMGYVLGEVLFLSKYLVFFKNFSKMETINRKCYCQWEKSRA